MGNGTGGVLNPYQKRRLQGALYEADRLLSDIEQVLNSAGSKSPFPKYVVDLMPAQRKTIEDYIGRIRARLVRVLEGQNIEPESPSIPATRAIHSALTFIDIAVEELKPRSMRGYGEVPTAAAAELNGIVGELSTMVQQLDRYVTQRCRPMTFQSILFQNTPDRAPDEQLTAPDFFVDLNLDQIVAAITAGKEEYNLKPVFYASLRDVDAITWRHEIMQDLENIRLFDNIKAFAENMRAMRKHLVQAEKLYYKLQKERWFLDAVEIYCDAVTCLVHNLSVAEFTARGLLAFREYVTQYAASERFTALVEQTKKLVADLSAIHYTVLINSPHVQVRHYGGEPDYSMEVEATFERFKQGDVKEHSFNFSDSPQMNNVEAQILALVAQLYPEIFSALENYCTANKDYQDGTIVTFDSEIQFYIAYLEHIARFKKAGLNFCYPRVVQDCKEVCSYQGFDLALAGKLIPERAAVVCNDFHLSGRERMIVVSGPNQGGKTTFARTFGQLHYLASLGCPIPGTRAQLFLFDRLLTHFEREENIKNLRGKLQDDLVRVHQILERATPNSIVIMNEIFTSTTLRDAVVLSKNIAAKLTALDLLCVWVTFVDELASLGEQTVSMVSTVVPENPAMRTYKIVRRSADGLAYAMSIAEKYRLTHTMIKERIDS